MFVTSGGMGETRIACDLKTEHTAIPGAAISAVGFKCYLGSKAG